MSYKFCLVLMFSLIFIGCSSKPKMLVSSCSEGRTLLDGSCVDEDIVDYVSCVRARGADLGSSKSKTLSAEVGYFGVKAGGVSEVRENLKKKYTTSNKEMMAVIKQCGNMTSGKQKERPLLADNLNHPVIPNTAKVPAPIEANVVEISGVNFELINCEKAGRDVHCNFYLTSDGIDMTIQIAGSSKIFDDAGNSYTANLSQIANKEGKIYPGLANRTRILADLKTESLLVFPNFSTKAQSISRFEIVFSTIRPKVSKAKVVPFRNIAFNEKPVLVKPQSIEKVRDRQFSNIESNGLKFKLINCKKVVRDVHCSFNLTADGRDVTMQIAGNSTIFDEFGNAYNANLSQIANKEQKIYPGLANRTSLLADLKVNSLLVFPNISSKSRTIKRLEIDFSIIRPAVRKGQVSYSDIPMNNGQID